VFDALFDLYYADGLLGGYFLKKESPALTLHATKAKGGMRLRISPQVKAFETATAAYVCSEDDIYRMSRAEFKRMKPALELLNEEDVFFVTKDAAAFCSYVLPELGDRLRVDDPDQLLLNQIPLAPVVQFYLDVPGEMVVAAHAEFLYGEDKVTPFVPVREGFLRDARAERRAAQLLGRYLHQTPSGAYETADEEEVYRFLEEGIPALLAAGEVYLSEAFRNLQVPAPKVTVGVSVHGSVLDLDIDTGEFPAEELKGLLQSLRRKKRYHRLRDGRLLRLDDSLNALDELNETLELSGTSLADAHATLPLYRAPSLDSALAGAGNVRFNRDDAFRRISRSFHSVQDSDYALPASLQGVLRKYQRDGYRWLRTLDSYGMGGILADDMGLGKTLQVLAYLLAMKENGQNQSLPSLVVCPASLVLNWGEECAKFTPQLRCLTVDGGAARRADLALQFGEYDLIVTSYDLLRRDSERYETQAFYACILDEAQAIKNHATQKYRAVCRVNSRVRFALTGTPVENRLSELWSIFSFLMPGYLYPYKTFCERFEKPIVQDGDEAAVRRLNQQTGPFLLRRMKADVLKELPPKIENVQHVALGEEQRKLYLAAVLDAKERLRAAKPEDRMAVFAVLMRLRQICCDPRLVAENWTGGSAKLDACMELVTAAVESGHRILLFSQFTSMLALLEQRLDEEQISHFKLEGSTPKPVRAQLVRRFNAGEASVFLISLRAGGTGLNLTAADVVIHYDPWWNVAAQNQATDRAYRIGQQNTVQVYKLIAQDTVENKILELQQAKSDLAQSVTGTADGAIMAMKPDELLELLGG
jgi:SNF2 family DNA or RNA helicase